ncbi:hypothetical protein Nepgr_024467 [Nepenthes gracilis]|uniref:Expansin-like B1 n=1 Tax=Nepenthes gracilis TaxID=150966 RepID=A0AAD3T590_NEPGR|nr:hypothetical protein Nepgr_024467 [Nepenthes gracilis]
MNFAVKFSHFIFLFALLLLPLLTYTQDFVCSRATYYGSPNCLGNPTGACGYGDYGTTVNDGNVAAVSGLYRGGIGCGGCYQVRCKSAECTDDGVQVVVTDHGAGDHTDFIMSPRSYGKMARPGLEGELLAYGVVDIDYRRVPCRYGGSNLIVVLHERSSYPHYLALLIKYQPGLIDVVAVEIWQEDCKEWRPMRKPFGAVWDMENPPRGTPLSIRFIIIPGGAASANDAQSVEMPSLIPDNWKAGDSYDTGIQLN